MDQEEISIAAVTADEDLAGVAGLAGQIWRKHYPGILTTEQIEYMLARMYSLDTLRAEIRGQGICFYQLLVGGQMAGFASIGPAKTQDTVKLHKLYVRPEIHGQGLGRRLLNHCENEATRFRAKKLILAVNKRNEKAIAFYQRNGFVVIESVVNDIGRGFVMDDFIMGKKCG